MSVRTLLTEAPPEPQFSESRPTRRKWLGMLIWEIPMLILTVIGIRYVTAKAPVEPISLALVERDAGELRIEWNHAAKPVSDAQEANIDIIDGVESQSVALTPAMLAAGHYTYSRETGDIQVRMTVTDAFGNQVRDAMRFLGQPIEALAQLRELRKARAELETEARTLKAKNDTQAARIQTLERTLRSVQNKLGIAPGQEP